MSERENFALPRAGDLVAGKYEVLAVLGSGGMGVVVTARHRELGQRFAIKFLRAPKGGDDPSVARFVREARAMAMLRCEHVVRIHDVGRLEDGAPYLVMEHLEGSDLNVLLRTRGALPVGDAVDYVLQACEAISEAHAAGIVHRDLKPANLFLTRRSDDSPLVKVLDFGISKIQNGEPTLTGTADVLGSPQYMSPEQLRDSRGVDARTDVWALGVILHRLLTLRQPFEAESIPVTMSKIMNDPPVPLRVHRPDAPAALEALILRCLEKDLDRRVPSVADLARALVPFAPAGAAGSLERIVGVVSAGGQRAAPRPASGWVPASPSILKLGPAPGASETLDISLDLSVPGGTVMSEASEMAILVGRRWSPRRRAAAVAAGGLGLMAALVLVAPRWLADAAPAASVSAAQASAAAPLPAVPPAPTAAPSSEPLPSPPATASARAPLPRASRVAKPLQAPSAEPRPAKKLTGPFEDNL